MRVNRQMQPLSPAVTEGAVIRSPLRPRIMVVIGTRPEAIKLCPVVTALRTLGLRTSICATGQHREMAQQVFEIFRLCPDFVLNVLTPDQTLSALSSRLIGQFGQLLEQTRPSILLVQGDTTTTLCAAMVGFYHRIPIVHVEAGLRTFDSNAPFPEEMNRKLISQIATLHCAATDWSASNLKNEGTPANSILVSGNPGIDALQMVAEALNTGRRPRNPSRFDQTKKLILVTAHRRENFGRPLARICKAVKQIAARPDVEVVWPLHPNPNVRRTVRNTLAGGTENLHLIEPLDYLSFVDLMMQSYILLTDSGGIQEEGCCLGRPVLVLRSKTERPEALLAGTNMLVSTDVRAIVGAVARLLDDATHYGLMAKVCSIYGDGQASARIAQRIVSEFGLKTFESERAVAAASQLRDRMARFDAGDRKSAS